MKNTFAKFFASLVMCLGAGGALAATKVGTITIPRPQNGANGDSAMQIWCKENPNETCSVENFLAKIKGPKGDDGADATDFCEKLDSATQAKTVKTSVREYSPYVRGDDGYAIEVGGFQTTIEYCSGSGQGFEADKCETIPAASTAEKDLPAKCNGTVKKCTQGDNGSTVYYMCDGAESCYSSTSTRTPHGGRTSDENGPDGVVYTTVGYVTTTVSRGCRGNGTRVETEAIVQNDDCIDPKVVTGHGVSYVYYTCSYSDGSKVMSYVLRKTLASGTALYDLTQKMDTATANQQFATKWALNQKADTSTVSSLQSTVDSHTTSLANKLDKPSGGSAGQVLKWTTGGGVEWGSVSPNVQMTTFTGDTHLYYCGKTNGTCNTSDQSDGWQSVEMSALSGTDGNTGWLRRNSSTGNIEVCYKPTQSSCTTSDWTTLVSGTQIKGDPGDPGDPGASALDIYRAAMDDDTLTENDFFEYLTGPQGPKGDNGNDGANGKDGKDGKDACQTYTYERDSANDTENEYAYKIICADAE